MLTEFYWKAVFPDETLEQFKDGIETLFLEVKKRNDLQKFILTDGCKYEISVDMSNGEIKINDYLVSICFPKELVYFKRVKGLLTEFISNHQGPHRSCFGPIYSYFIGLSSPFKISVIEVLPCEVVKGSRFILRDELMSSTWELTQNYRKEVKVELQLKDYLHFVIIPKEVDKNANSNKYIESVCCNK